jgi:hypothetical protein
MLNDDGTFEFHDQGCVAQHYTEGYWKDCQGKVSLTSYDRYKKVNITKLLESANDTIKMYFDSELLYLTGDALFGVKNNKYFVACALVRPRPQPILPFALSFDSLRGTSLRTPKTY